jgi:hypothetical protein
MMDIDSTTLDDIQYQYAGNYLVNMWCLVWLPIYYIVVSGFSPVFFGDEDIVWIGAGLGAILVVVCGGVPLVKTVLYSKIFDNWGYRHSRKVERVLMVASMVVSILALIVEYVVYRQGEIHVLSSAWIWLKVLGGLCIVVASWGLMIKPYENHRKMYKQSLIARRQLKSESVSMPLGTQYDTQQYSVKTTTIAISAARVGVLLSLVYIVVWVDGLPLSIKTIMMIVLTIAMLRYVYNSFCTESRLCVSLGIVVGVLCLVGAICIVSLTENARSTGEQIGYSVVELILKVLASTIVVAVQVLSWRQCVSLCNRAR